MYAWVWSYWTGTALLMIVWQEAWQAAEGTARVRGVDFCPLSSPYIYGSFIPTQSLSLFFLCLDWSFNLSYSCCHTLTHLLFETQLSVCTRPEASCLFKTDICQFDYYTFWIMEQKQKSICTFEKLNNKHKKVFFCLKKGFSNFFPRTLKYDDLARCNNIYILTDIFIMCV